MILNKLQIIERLNNLVPMVTNIKDRGEQLQSTGLDLTVKKIYGFESAGILDFNNSKRELATKFEIEPKCYNTVPGIYYLRPGCYQIEVNEVFHIPLDIVARTISRSTLQRCGAAIFEGYFDPRYIGGGVSLLNVCHPKGIYIYPDAKICQMIFEMTTETEGYAGIYTEVKKLHPIQDHRKMHQSYAGAFEELFIF